MRVTNLGKIEEVGAAPTSITVTNLLCGADHECHNPSTKHICAAIVCAAHKYVHAFCSQKACVARNPT